MNNRIRFLSVGIALSLILSQSFGTLAGQASLSKPARLTIERIMDGPDFSGTTPTEVRWSVDGKSLYFRWKKADEKKDGVYVVAVEGGLPRRLSDNEERVAPPFGGVEDEGRTRKLFVADGDIFLLDLRTGNRRQLTQTIAAESAPGFTLNPDHVYFTRENNLYLLSLSTGAL